MNIIDALVVTLGLDSKDLDSKTPAASKKLDQLNKSGEKVEKSVAKINKTSKETARSVESLSRTVTGFLAIIGGTVAIKSFIQDFIDTNAQLDRLSKNLGVSVSTISAWSNASEKLGGSAQGLQGTLDMLSKSQTQLMITGESSLIPYFSALGVSLAGVNGQARPVTDILLDLADRFSHMDRTEANNLGRMMGIDQGTMNLLLQGRKELELEIKRQKEQTAVTKAQAEQAQKFQTEIVGLKQRFQALGRALFMDAAPYLEKFFDLLERVGKWAQENKDHIKNVLEVVAVGLGAIALASLPIDLTVLAVVALAAAFALLWDDYQTWAKGGKSAFNWGDFAEGIEVTVRWVKQLAGWLKEAYQWLDKVMTYGQHNDPSVSGIPNAHTKGDKRRALNGEPVIAAPTANREFAPGGSMAAQARYYAQQASNQTGIPADLIFAQWQHETGGFTNRGATKLNNFAGINNPGGNGEDYKSYSSLGDFTADYVNQLKRNFTGTLGASNVDAFVAGLHNGRLGSYFHGSPNAYASAMSNWLNKDHSNYAFSMAAIPGAAGMVQNPPLAGGASNVDKSIKTDIGTVVVNTQATDAAGIVNDMRRSLDYLFISQGNYGLF